MFTEKEFHGAHNTLDPGRVYKTLDDMGLGSPVLSLRKFYKVISDMTLNKVYQGKTALILLMLYFSFLRTQPSSLVLYEDEEYGGEALVRVKIISHKMLGRVDVQ